MRQITPNELRELITDLNNELANLEQLKEQIEFVQSEMVKHPELSTIFVENLALKLHNFYTGCERIFKIIASELNGGLPSSYDWHRRLLMRMAKTQEDRPIILRETTVQKLAEYLSFRHVVRNIYGFELQEQRVKSLVDNYNETWYQFKEDIEQFLNWLDTLANHLDN